MKRASLRPRTVWLIRHWPRQSFILASALDALTYRLGSSPDPRRFRRRVLMAATWHPSRRWPFPCTVTGTDVVSLRPPMILVSFHTGGIVGLMLLLEQLPGGVLVLSFNDPVLPPRPGIERISTGGGELARIAAAKKAGDVLRGGGSVFMMLDGGGPAQIPLEVFDGTYYVSSGAFRLARITGAPIVPVIAEWHGRRMEIALGGPIAPADEATMTAGLASWLEGVFPPGERRSRLISRLAG